MSANALNALAGDSEVVERLKRDAYHDKGLLVIDLNKDNIDWMLRELLTQFGDKRYPKRKVFRGNGSAKTPKENRDGTAIRKEHNR